MRQTNMCAVVTLQHIYMFQLRQQTAEYLHYRQ